MKKNNIPIIKRIINFNSHKAKSNNIHYIKSIKNSSIYNNFLNNSHNYSFFHSSLIKKNNNIKSEGSLKKNKTLNLNPTLLSKKSINNNNLDNQGLSQIFKYKYKYLLDKKDDNSNVHLSYDSTLINSNNDSNKNKLKKRIIFNNIIDNKTNYNKSKYTNFSYDNITHMSDTANTISLSFNKELNNYLINNNYKFYNKQSLLTFKEKNNVSRKLIFFNYFCKKLIYGKKKNNYFQDLLNIVEKSNEIYEKYKNDMDCYLHYIKKEKIKEKINLNELINEKLNIKEIINDLYNQIDKNKYLFNESKNIKEFLLKVKYGVLNIEDLPEDISNLYYSRGTTNSDSISNYENINNFGNNEKVLILNLPDISKNNNNDFKNQYNPGKLINNNLYITPINYKKRRSISKNTANNELNKVHNNFQRLYFKNKTQIYKKINYNLTHDNNINIENKKIINNYSIFDTPEEFMLTYDLLINKIKKNLDYYNQLLRQNESLKKKKSIQKNFFMDDQLEKHYKIIINTLKRENSILKNKLKLYSKLNKIFGQKEILANKIKNILLNINSVVNIEKKYNIYQFELKLEKYETGNLQTKAEKNKTKNKFLMEILEKIYESLISTDELYKNNPKYKEEYKKIRANQENIKFKKIRMIQMSKLKRKEQEKNKRVIDNFTKVRFLSLNKKGMTLYNHNNSLKKKFKKKISFNETFSIIPFFNFSFDGKNKDYNIKENILYKKRVNKLKEKKEEIYNLLLY